MTRRRKAIVFPFFLVMILGGAMYLVSIHRSVRLYKQRITDVLQGSLPIAIGAEKSLLRVHGIKNGEFDSEANFLGEGIIWSYLKQNDLGLCAIVSYQALNYSATKNQLSVAVEVWYEVPGTLGLWKPHLLVEKTE